MTEAQRLVNCLLFEAEPMVHPHVLDAYQQAVNVLTASRVPFRVMGGMAMNLKGAGRPTKDVDFIVPRAQWSRALSVLRSIATDTQGVRGEPDGGLASTHEEIARLRGAHRAHPAGKLALTLKGDAVTGLLNSKLASHLSATDRLRDASDVQALIKRLNLPIAYAAKLAPAVRAAFVRIWKGRV